MSPMISTIPDYLEPPGCLREILLHPTNKNECVELSLMQEHRFAFYYWLKWTNELNNVVPSLITFDWHQDLAPPYEDEIDGLKSLNTMKKGEVAFYTWANLSHHNDVQIRAAILLNKIKDVYVVCRQKSSRKNKEVIVDFFGNKHTIYITKSISEFEQFLPKIQDDKIYFDIDLDYFTVHNPYSMNSPYSGKKFTFVGKKEISNIFSFSNPTIKWIFERIAGFTIATEPKFCGGLKKSNYFLQILDGIYFTPSLFFNQPESGGTQWRHHYNENR